MRSNILFVGVMLSAAVANIHCSDASVEPSGFGYDPCAGKECGAGCTVCDPADPYCSETAVVKACDGYGRCVTAQEALCLEQCTYYGVVYNPGESFPARDGCNTCSCTGNGEVICTLVACGVTCGMPDSPSCAANEYCSFPFGECGEEVEGGPPGVCAPVPDLCPNNYLPVCGCNFATFGNACQAAAARMSVRSAGECD